MTISCVEKNGQGQPSSCPAQGPVPKRGYSAQEHIDELHIDIETFSSTKLDETGVYKYVESNDFGILLFGVSINGGDVRVYDLACGDRIPTEILNAIVDNGVIKCAHNANFERICLSAYLRKHYPLITFENPANPDYLNPKSWRCTMIMAAYNGLPLSLDMAGEVLALSNQKLSEGKALIKYFCEPCAPTKGNNQRTRNLPEHDRAKWEQFKRYNKRDVEVELEIYRRLKKYSPPDSVWEEYRLDQEINDRGIKIDRELVEQAIKIHEIARQEILAKLQELTGLDNPNSPKQLVHWLREKDERMTSVDKKYLATIPPESIPDEVAEVLELREQSSKTSIKKYQAMLNCVCADGRCHGMFQFYGASRTGRWAGRLVQLQNLPKNRIKTLDQARELVKQGDYDALRRQYDNIPQVLSELIRTAFIPEPGQKFVVSDYSAIEARVLAHIAGEDWRTQVFADGGDIYCASASQMFGVPVEKDGINGHMRDKGKVAELALGYGGSIGALKAMGALKAGLSEDELQPLVDSWRSANPEICAFWKEVDQAAIQAVELKTAKKVGPLRFVYKSGMLFIYLPSGRRLSYAKPSIGRNRFGGKSITYFGLDAQKRWTKQESYGAKIVENIVQAISRDILCYAMRNLSGYRIVAHVHDELIIEAPVDTPPQEICDKMGQPPPWIDDLLLCAVGFNCQYYRKD